MNEIKIILLCNNRELCFYGNLAAVLIPGNNKDVVADVQMILKDTGIPFLAVKKKTFTMQVQQVLQETKAEAGFIMTFPFKLEPLIYSAPRRGFFNFHYGILPQYRGPEPIFAQIKNREIMAVVMEEKIRIEQEDTYGMLQSKLAYIGAGMAGNLVKTLHFSQAIPSKAQDESKAVYHQRPGLNDVLINWKEMDSTVIKALVNACNPWNKGAGTRIKNYMIGLLEVEISAEETAENIVPGTIVSLNSGGLYIATKDKRMLKVTVIYCPEGYISGHRLSIFGIKLGDRFD
jgi:methionyl-tRNA formyltransferase